MREEKSMSELYTTTGTLSDKQTILLENPVPWPPGRVRVTIETLPTAKPNGTFLSKLAAIRQQLKAQGHRFRSKEEIDAQIEAERASWEN
jgi:hypothetical protein